MAAFTESLRVVNDGRITVEDYKLQDQMSLNISTLHLACEMKKSFSYFFLGGCKK